MKKGLFKEPQMQLLFTTALIIFVFFLGLSGIYFKHMLEDINQDYLKRNIIITGTLVEKHPELEAGIVSLVVQKPNEDYYEKGLNILNKYGYTEKLKAIDNQGYKETYQRLKYVFYFNSLFFVIMFLMFMYITMRQIYKKLEGFSISIDKIMKGSFDIRLPCEGEGLFAVLGFQFNQMAKRLQITMDELIKEKTKLKDWLSDISHQLKTPLASLRTFNELLLDGEDENIEVRHEFLETSSKQIDKMEWLIYNLLQISRLESGIIKLNLEDINLLKTIRDTIEALRFKAVDKNQSIEIKCSLEDIYYYHDVKWFGEALKNIIENSIKYTSKNGKIDVMVNASEARIKITIKDNGCGIREEDIPHVFERFYRGKSSEGKALNGSGIGLSLSKLIVEMHGGFISISSQVGIGTTMDIVLPITPLKDN